MNLTLEPDYDDPDYWVDPATTTIESTTIKRRTYPITSEYTVRDETTVTSFRRTEISEVTDDETYCKIHYIQSINYYFYHSTRRQWRL